MNVNLPIFSWFFILGTVVLVIGVLWDISIWLKGRYTALKGFQGFFRAIFSRQIVVLLKAFVMDVFIQTRLWRQDKLRWVMKELIIFGYVGVITINEIKSGTRVPGVHEATGGSHFLDFFVSPFCDFYYLREVGQGLVHFSGIDAFYAFMNDLFAGMVVLGEFIAIYRRFVRKSFMLKSTTFEIASVMLLGGWFIFRFISEAISMVAYDVPNSDRAYWFIGWLISKPIGLIHVSWQSATTPMWTVSSILLMLLFASIPFNIKLWHIFMTPLNTMINSVPHNPRALEGVPGRIPFSARQLIELDSCMKCQICADNCQVTTASQENPDLRLYYSYAGVHTHLKHQIRRKYGPDKLFVKPPSEEEMQDFQFEVFNCLLCGRCREVCPAMIDTREMGLTNRQNLYREGRYAKKKMDPVIEAISTENNVANFPNADRAMWVDYLPEPPEDLYQRKNADVIYFVGCMASFSPVVQDIPGAFVEVLDRAGVNFTIMAEDEWCCGYPLIVGGMKDEIKQLIAHNTEAVRKTGAKKMVFSCPSCYHTFKHEYDIKGVEMLHHTQYLKQLIDEGKIELKEKVELYGAYHDPCDLGRNSGIYDEPRDVVAAIPGLKHREFTDNREMALCCGGGGDIEILDPDLSSHVSMDIVDEAGEIGIDTIITACQQCKRVIKGATIKSKSGHKVLDISEVVLQAMGPKE